MKTALLKIMIRYTPKLPWSAFLWRRVYGLGIAWETLNIVSDDMQWAGRKAHVKIFLGPLLVRFDVPIERKKPANLGRADPEMCEGCEKEVATTSDSDGVPLCQKCADTLPADGTNDQS